MWSPSIRTRLHVRSCVVQFRRNCHHKTPTAVKVIETPPLDTGRQCRTAILLLHKGEPSNRDDALRHLAMLQSHRYYGLPLKLTSLMKSLWYQVRGDRLLKQLFEEAERVRLPSLRQQHGRLGEQLSITLDQFLPDLAPFRCYQAYAEGESHAVEPTISAELPLPSIYDTLERLRIDAPERVIVLLMYPFYWCQDSGFVVNDLVSALSRRSFESSPEAAESSRCLISSADTSFSVSPAIKWSLIDRWSTHPVFHDTFAQLIETRLQELPSEIRDGSSILFCAPNKRLYDSREYRHELATACYRISENLQHQIPWRLGFYSSWDSVRWNVGGDGVLTAAHRLRNDGFPNIILTPIAHCFRNLDSDVVLPSVFTERTLRWLGAQIVRVAAVEATDSTLVHGLAEVVRNHCLSGRATFTANFANRCRFCFRKSCVDSRRMLCRL